MNMDIVIFHSDDTRTCKAYIICTRYSFQMRTRSTLLITITNKLELFEYFMFRVIHLVLNHVFRGFNVLQKSYAALLFAETH